MPDPHQLYLACQAHLKHNPQDMKAWAQLGRCLQSLGRFKETISCFRHVLTQEPTWADVWNELGLAYQESYRFQEAQQALERANQLQPTPGVYNNLARLFFVQGEVFKALEYQEICIKAALATPEYFTFYSNYLFMLRAWPNISPQERFQAFLNYAPTPTAPCPPRRKHFPLRLGYFSPDLRHHSVSVNFKPLFQYHTPQNFEIFAYHDHPLEDDRTAFFKQYCLHWRTTAHLTDAQVIEQIRQDRLDILVDLASHTAGNRLRIFREYLAPVQVSGLGLGYTTGLRTIDYLVCDPDLLPPNFARYSSEKLFYLPCFFYWEPPESPPPTTAPPSLTQGHLTFGCGNEVFKLNQDVVVLWSRILQTLPTSRLHLKARAFGNRQLQQRYRQLFQNQGISPERIQFQGATNRSEHMAFYNQIDVALDPFPYQGGSTTCEALYMGVPVITLAQGTRSSVSILQRVGLGELIAHSLDHYTKIAGQLEPRLSQLRQEIPLRFRESLLIQGRAFCHHMERAYQAMYFQGGAQKNG